MHGGQNRSSDLTPQIGQTTVMDLNTVTSVSRPRTRGELGGFAPGDAWLAGGTWLFSEPQPALRRLVDLAGLRWPPLSADDDGLTIAATCTIADLYAFEAPPAWTAAPLFAECCRAFLASFKIWGMATVGGNLCLALPAGPMIALCAALDGVCVLWTPDGGTRQMAVVDFVTGAMTTALQPGEVLRAVHLPAATLRRRTAFRRASLTPLGRSGALLIGTASGDSFQLTVTAATRRPVQLDFAALPSRSALIARLDEAIPAALYYDDIHGRPDWRAHMTRLLANELRDELARFRE